VTQGIYRKEMSVGARLARVSVRVALASCALVGAAEAEPRGGEAPVVWAAWSASPQPIDPAAGLASSDREAELLARCGRGEAGLRAVAERLVRQRLRGETHLDLDAIVFAMRAAGEPHVWPRAWVVAGRALDHDATLDKLEAWGKTFRDPGDRRCGVAVGGARDGTEVVAAVALDALADLSPLPTTARVGMFVALDSQAIVPLASPQVILQGPGAEPRAVPTWTSLENGVAHVRARFLAERPGPFTVQIVADADTGPRPILEARLFADVAPPDQFGG
jgi:hypothetical protein